MRLTLHSPVALLNTVESFTDKCSFAKPFGLNSDSHPEIRVMLIKEGAAHRHHAAWMIAHPGDNVFAGCRLAERRIVANPTNVGQIGFSPSMRRSPARLRRRAIQIAASEACRQAEDAQGFQHERRQIAAGSGTFCQCFGRRLDALCFASSVFDVFANCASNARHGILCTADSRKVDCVAHPFLHSRHILREGRSLVGDSDRGFQTGEFNRELHKRKWPGSAQRKGRGLLKKHLVANTEVVRWAQEMSGRDGVAEEIATPFQFTLRGQFPKAFFLLARRGLRAVEARVDAVRSAQPICSGRSSRE